MSKRPSPEDHTVDPAVPQGEKPRASLMEHRSFKSFLSDPASLVSLDTGTPAVGGIRPVPGSGHVPADSGPDSSSESEPGGSNTSKD